MIIALCSATSVNKEQVTTDDVFRSKQFNTTVHVI